MGINKKLFTDSGAGPVVATDNFTVTNYTGTNLGKTITGIPFGPQLVWVKDYGSSVSHMLADNIRGAERWVEPDTNDEEDDSSTAIKQFTSDGFVAGGSAQCGSNNDTYVGWLWKAGGSASSNTDGTITSQVSVNLAAGFSIATYTGNGTQNATIGHGLGSAQDLVLIKNRDNNDAWFVSHVGLDSNQFVELDNTSVATTNSALNHQRLSTTFKTTGSTPHHMFNASGEKYVLYSFKNIAGYQKFGTYTWTGTNYTAGTMVSDLGFTPRFVMIKGKNEDSNFSMYDFTRKSGTQHYRLAANSNAAQSTSGYQGIGFDSNGFSAIVGADGNTTGSGGLNKQNGVYLYWAIA